jgi:hypothetical protein
MNCYYCDSEILHVKEEFEIESPIIGQIMVPGVEFEVCTKCGDKLLLPGMGDYIAEYVREEEQIAIGQIPFDDFITAKEAIEILGFSKQALSKKAPEVKNGLIMSRMKDGRRYFVKKSVELYKGLHDGRYLIQLEKDIIIVYQTKSKPLAKTKAPKEYVVKTPSIWTNTIRSKSRPSNSSEVLNTQYDFGNR